MTPTPATLLIRTINILKTQPTLAKRMFFNPATNCSCIIGALNGAASGAEDARENEIIQRANTQPYEFNRERNRERNKAQQAIMDALAKLKGLEDRTYLKDGVGSVFKYNDAHTKEEAIALVESALALVQSAPATNEGIGLV